MLRHQLGALALVAALAVPFVASAQTVPGPQAGQNAPAGPAAGMPAHHHHGSRYMRAMRDLNLTDAQKSQIKSIMQSARSADAGNAAATDPQTRRQNMMTTRRQIEGVLTDTQRTQLQANLTKMRHDKNAAGPGGQTAPAQPR